MGLVANILFGWDKGGVAKDVTDFDYASATVPFGALFVEADEPLMVYPSVAAAEQHLEAVDVENGIYPAAYGPNGEPYRIGVEGNCVIIEPTGDSNEPGNLSLLLLRYLEAKGRIPDATATFDDLVATVWAIESDFWREHDPNGDRFGTRISLWGCTALVALVAVAFYFMFR